MLEKWKKTTLDVPVFRQPVPVDKGIIPVSRVGGLQGNDVRVEIDCK